MNNTTKQLQKTIFSAYEVYQNRKLLSTRGGIKPIMSYLQIQKISKKLGIERNKKGNFMWRQKNIDDWNSAVKFINGIDKK